MSEKELINDEGVVETITEVGTSNTNIMAKAAVAGVLIAAGIGVVVYIKKRRANKVELDETVVLEEIKNSKKKSEK